MGRFIIGMLGLTAALGYVIYSAVVAYSTNYSMTSQFAELAGLAAAGACCWEALGALYVRALWRDRSYVLGIGVAILVMAATIWLLRLDLRFHVAGQSDVIAKREATIENRDTMRSEYNRARARRDDLQKAVNPSKFQQGELIKAEKRIAELEPKLWGPEIISSGSPDASWMSRIFSGESRHWADILMIAGLLFGALFRIFAMPAAIAYMQARREPVGHQGRAEAPGAIIIPQMASPVPGPSLEAFVKPSELEPEPVTPPEPPKGPKRDTESVPAPAVTEAPRPTEPFVPRVVENAPPKPRSKAERMEAVDAVTRRWIKARGVVKVISGDGIPASAAYRDYVAFAGASAVGNSHFGRSIKRCGFATKSTATGAVYRLRINGEASAVA